jgi:hypothetical protein
MFDGMVFDQPNARKIRVWHWSGSAAGLSIHIKSVDPAFIASWFILTLDQRDTSRSSWISVVIQKKTKPNTVNAR